MRFVVAVVATLLVMSCTNGEDVAERTPRPKVTCSAAGMEQPREPSGLPVAVAMMRKEIIKAATRCEYDLLERLALNGLPIFNYSFGEPNAKPEAQPGPYWEAQEQRDEPALATMLRLVRLPFAVTTIDEKVYIWPSVGGEAPSDDDWRAVEEEFGVRQVEGWRAPEGYLGPRVGISSRGDWLFYVAGD